ncbi:MAG: hypothetical protein CFE46_15610 [Burkholderiales bacterium PBB6]|nr:MAG: hypothetical protein CFE46_15610 [Burkholderiales bacterium PBB6]
MSLSRWRSGQPLSLRCAGWLVAVLLLAQGLGSIHHLVHARGLALPAAVASATAGAPAAETDAASASDRWQHQAASADCRLLDQLLWADALGGPAPALAVFAFAHLAPAPATLAALPSRFIAGYLARGPPTTA